MEHLDDVKLNFDDSTLTLMNICLGIIMFGIALGLSLSDFKRLIEMPRLVVVGFISQFLVLPVITFAFIWLIRPLPSIALGMFLVAACPGGNISNFLSALSKANVALSVTLTAISTSIAAILTPLNFTLWASLYPDTAPLLRSFDINLWDMLKTVLMLLGIPLFIGLAFKYRFENLAARIVKPVQQLSLVIFIAFIVFALKGNWEHFSAYIHLIFFMVLLHNGLALAAGYAIGQIFGFSVADKRTIAIETGIQNAGLGLIIVFNFFEGLGGMAIITAWWGVWDMIAGLLLAYFWSRRAA